MFRRVPANQAGFTLIELLVVIAIIGVLASTVLASLNTSRMAARDARRMSEARQLQTALELHRNANNGLYPCAANLNPTGGFCNMALTHTVGGSGNGVSVFSDATATGRDTALITALNIRPAFDTNRVALVYRVASGSDRSSYTIRVYKEVGNTYCTMTMGTGSAVWTDPRC